MIDYDPKLFRIKRHILGLSQEQLANKCRITRPTISTVERNKNLTPSTILLIGMVLDNIADEKGVLETFYALEGERTSFTHHLMEE